MRAQRLSLEQWRAMRMLQDMRKRFPEEPYDGSTCSDRTWYDVGPHVMWPAFINWRTAKALADRGLVTYEYVGPEDGAELKLTEDGVDWREPGGA